MIITKNITGWKWDSIEQFNDDCQIADAFFGYPKVGEFVTNSCMEATPNYDAQMAILFYYVADNIQLREVLAPPANFDINIEIPD